MTIAKSFLVALTIVVSACETTHAPTLTEGGVYIVYYKWYDVIEEFGPGVKQVRERVRQSESAHEQSAAWDEALVAAIPKYLNARHIMPAACTNGVVILRSGTSEGGNGDSTFRCKDVE